MEQEQTYKQNFAQDKKGFFTENQMTQANSVDICFLIDITKSMQDYVESTMKSLKNIITLIQQRFNCPIRIGFVGYRDMLEENPGMEQFEWINLDSYSPEEIESSKLYQKLNSIKCSGGGDFTEDIKGAIMHATKVIDWKAELRFLILITDAPAHGVKYNQGYKDNHPGEDLDESLTLLIEKNIKLTFFEISDYTKTMLKEIQKFYSDKQLPYMFEHQKLETQTLEVIQSSLCKCLTETIKNIKFQ